jgi:hypothetical protein
VASRFVTGSFNFPTLGVFLMKLKSIAAAALALGAVVTSAQAGVQEAGTLTTAAVAISVPADPSENWGWIHFTLGTGLTGVTGSLIGAGAVSLQYVDLFADPNLAPGQEIGRSLSPDSFTFDGLTVGQLYKLEWVGGAAATGSIAGIGAVTAVPEPELWLGLASGMALLGWSRRRQQKA